MKYIPRDVLDRLEAWLKNCGEDNYPYTCNWLSYVEGFRHDSGGWQKAWEAAYLPRFDSAVVSWTAWLGQDRPNQGKAGKEAMRLRFRMISAMRSRHPERIAKVKAEVQKFYDDVVRKER